MRQKLFDENNLPSVFNFDDQPIAVAFDVEDRVGIYEIGMRVYLSHIRKTSPNRVSSNLVPV
jgi:hypothetical protein